MEKLLHVRKLSVGQKAQDKISEDLRKLVLNDYRKVTELWKRTDEAVKRLEKEKNDFTLHLAGIEDDISRTAEKLIAAIQLDKAKLLSEVQSIKLERVKQVETVKQELEHHMRVLESFKRYKETLLSSGTACDVARSANSLHDRANELLKFDVIGHVDSSLPPVTVTFSSSTLLDGDERSLVGTVTVEGQLKQKIVNIVRKMELANLCWSMFHILTVCTHRTET